MIVADGEVELRWLALVLCDRWKKNFEDMTLMMFERLWTNLINPLRKGKPRKSHNIFTMIYTSLAAKRIVQLYLV